VTEAGHARPQLRLDNRDADQSTAPQAARRGGAGFVPAARGHQQDFRELAREYCRGFENYLDGVSTNGDPLTLERACRLRLRGWRCSGDDTILELHLVNLFERAVAFNTGVSDGQTLNYDTAPEYPRQCRDRAQSVGGDFHQRHVSKTAHDVNGAICVPFFMSSVISQITPVTCVAWIHTRV